MWQNSPVMGQMVQVISNRLDGGAVVAFAETRVHPWSYRATLLDSYRQSPLLLNQAIRNALLGRFKEKSCQGRNFRLPSNRTVATLFGRMTGRALGRLFYGGFKQKEWRVSVASHDQERLAELVEGDAFPEPSRWRTFEVPNRYVFYADPFFSSDPPGLVVEALRRSSGIGEIVLIDGKGPRAISRCKHHMSYPFTALVEGRQVIVPELASASAPKAYYLHEERMEELAPLNIEGSPHLLDPTLFEHQGLLYLFGNIRKFGTDALFLWSAPHLTGAFALHPRSPIRISPAGARMAGSLIKVGERLIRLGQDARAGYGNGVVAFEVQELSRDCYRERMISELRFQDRKGPHTMNFKDGQIAFDWYRESFAPLAGLRRLKATLSKR
jgi:hypothetical protein